VVGQISAAHLDNDIGTPVAEGAQGLLLGYSVADSDDGPRIWKQKH
jgi:hypothetical protein